MSKTPTLDALLRDHEGDIDQFGIRQQMSVASTTEVLEGLDQLAEQGALTRAAVEAALLQVVRPWNQHNPTSQQLSVLRHLIENHEATFNQIRGSAT